LAAGRAANVKRKRQGRDVLHTAGSCVHHLEKTGDGYRKLQRVEMTNARAADDYVLRVRV